MIAVTVSAAYPDTDDTNETKQLTVDPAQLVHEAIAEAFGKGKRQHVCFGDADVLENDSFVDHGIEVAVYDKLAPASNRHSRPRKAANRSDSANVRVCGRQDGARLSVSIKGGLTIRAQTWADVSVYVGSHRGTNGKNMGLGSVLAPDGTVEKLLEM